ncbi:alpha/beta fold hydrolase [Hyphomicrobium sp. CS1BSMeth3]|uniref:alpha/beta hydrolase n=1 Tax=Hyphomicrobium sp. CS1BSMeth3 TaxID=1892844 RepID=UPI0009308D54|nr:alpha/beta fold hydrolase [Hyphomicrobium sp. CS1BSMeth3]
MTFETQGYYVRGGRTGVLLMHGLCGTPTEMRFVANGLARTGCTVYCPMLAGHGGTEEDIKGTSWQDWYASAERALDRLREDCDTVIVGGLSTGAVLALLLAARRPADVQGTTLLAPTLWLNGWLIPWYARLFRLVFSKRIANLIGFPDLHPHGIKDERIREFIRNALFSGDSSVAGLPSTPGGAVLEHRRLVQAARAELGRIHQPALIIHPREDDYADLDNAWYLQRQLKGMVDMVVLDDSYHIVTVDRQRHVVVERTAAFVANVAQRMGAKAGAIAGTAAPARAAA